jgi:hypothetical protein
MAIILAVVGVIGCSLALARKNFAFSLIAAISVLVATIFSAAFYFVVPLILAILARVPQFEVPKIF